MMDDIACGFADAEHLFMLVNPSPLRVLRIGMLPRRVLSIFKMVKTVKAIANPKRAGKMLCRRLVTSAVLRPCRRAVNRQHARSFMAKRDIMRKNGMGGRSWIFSDLDRGNDGRIVKDMVVMYHDADRAGKHLDVHIGHLSLIIRVSGKPFEPKVRFNRHGVLTQSSKTLLMDHLRGEVAGNSRMAQNLDHSPQNARMSWLAGEDGLKGYGSGLTRQIVLEEPIEVLDVGDDAGQTLRMFCPSIWRHGQLFLHKLYPGKSKGSPIIIWGKLKTKDPKFEDRLDLTDIKPKHHNRFMARVDRKTITRKEDGAGTHFDTGNRFTTFWSPRISKETGHRIEYTHKLTELMHVTHPAKPCGMGEMLFRRRVWIFPIWRRMNIGEIGSVLTSGKIRPRDVRPDFMVYRIDRWDGKSVIDLSFFDNRALQEEFAELSQFIRLPELVRGAVRARRSWEGIVGVPPGKSIQDGIKEKFWGDEDDWEVESVALEFGPTGRTAGVVWFKSLSSGRRFKLGPGQLGSEVEVLKMMNDPKAFIGMVAKVKSRRGHEGRASKLQEWHLDKGVWKMGKPLVSKKVRQIISEKLGVDEKKVVNDARITADLGGDSLDQVELIMAFEDAYDIEITDEDAEKIHTVGQAIKYLKKRTA